MTRIYEIEADEFCRIQDDKQDFIILKDDKNGISSGDVLILQDIPEEGEKFISEIHQVVDWTLTEGLRKGYILCVFQQKQTAS